MKKIIIMAILSVPLMVTAQDNKAKERREKTAERKERVNQLIKQEEEGALIFQKQSTFAINLNSDGFGFTYEHGKYKTITKTNLWWLSLGERKDEKQFRQSNTFTSSGGGVGIVFFGNSYVYGKQNNFYFLRAGIGQQKTIGGKGNKNGVVVSGIYGGGLTLGMLKPYYVQIPDNTGQGTGTKDIRYADSTATVFLDPSAIIGGSGFGKGFGEIKYVPGITARAALRFDYGKYNETVSALEVGINAEYYTQAMPILVGVNDTKKFFFNGYISIVFGRRK
ncbi:MAG: hypothetical protein H7101_06060 [Deinococcales bacterium]|nr:hypothetical protein [Chitinophagaceae bacterium]